MEEKRVTHRLQIDRASSLAFPSSNRFPWGPNRRRQRSRRRDLRSRSIGGRHSRGRSSISRRIHHRRCCRRSGLREHRSRRGRSSGEELEEAIRGGREGENEGKEGLVCGRLSAVAAIADALVQSLTRALRTYAKGEGRGGAVWRTQYWRGSSGSSSSIIDYFHYIAWVWVHQQLSGERGDQMRAGNYHAPELACVWLYVCSKSTPAVV